MSQWITTRRAFLQYGLPFAIAGGSPVRAEGNDPLPRQSVRLQLNVNYEPVGKPSITAVLEENGAASVVFHRIRAVLERRSGIIAPAALDRIESAAAHAPLLRLLRSKRVFEVEEEEYFKDPGYSLRIQTGKGLHGALAGYPRDTPENLLAFIRLIEEGVSSLPKSSLAPAYIRSNRMDHGRFQAIRSAGRLPIRNVRELPEHARFLVRISFRKPREFIPITMPARRALDPFNSPYHVAILVDAETPFDCDLYGNQMQPPDPR